MWIHPRSTPPTDATLDRAVRALRETPSSETLSAAARSAILRRASEPGEARSPLAVLFPSSWRLAVAGEGNVVQPAVLSRSVFEFRMLE